MESDEGSGFSQCRTQFKLQGVQISLPGKLAVLRKSDDVAPEVGCGGWVGGWGPWGGCTQKGLGG